MQLAGKAHYRDRSLAICGNVMANPCLPHLPEAVYDVQAEVRPIHNTKLIWLLLLPGMAAALRGGSSV